MDASQAGRIRMMRGWLIGVVLGLLSSPAAVVADSYLLGAGFMGRGLALQIINSVKGIKLSAIFNRKIQRARNARSGARQLHEAFKTVGLRLEDFEGPRHKRIDHIKELLKTNRLGRTLSWKKQSFNSFSRVNP